MKEIKQIVCMTFASIAALLIARCALPNAGNTSETGNAIVAMLYNQNGSPAAGVQVYIRPKNTLADTSLKLSKTLIDTASTVTDKNGRYAFDSTLDTGTYVIEGASGNNAVLIDSVVVKTTTAADTLPPDTLKPAGALKGVISLSEGGDPRKVFVLAFGIDRFARVNADGSFKFSNLAEAKYDLRLISSLDNYGVLDTNAISVKSADTTDLDTISLPFTGIPTPKNVKIAYDTLKQIVTLSWSKADTALVKSYNVYRRNVGLNTVVERINANPVTGSSFRDSTVAQDSTYEYRIASVNGSATEGTKSVALSVIVVGVVTKINSFPAPSGSDPSDGYLWRIRKMHNNGFVGVHSYEVLLMDSSFKVISKWGTKGTGNGQFNGLMDVAVDENNNIYIPDKVNHRIQKFDSLGNFRNAWNCVDSSQGHFIYPYNLEINKAMIYVSGFRNDGSNNFLIQLYDTLGTYIGVLGENGSGNGQYFGISGIAVSSDGKVFIADINNERIGKFSSDGIFIENWSAQSNPENLYCDSSTILFQIINNEGTHPAKFYRTDGNYLAIAILGSVIGAFDHQIFARGVSANFSDVINVYEYLIK